MPEWTSEAQLYNGKKIISDPRNTKKAAEFDVATKMLENLKLEVKNPSKEKVWSLYYRGDISLTAKLFWNREDAEKELWENVEYQHRKWGKYVEDVWIQDTLEDLKIDHVEIIESENYMEVKCKCDGEWYLELIRIQ